MSWRARAEQRWYVTINKHEHKFGSMDKAIDFAAREIIQSDELLIIPIWDSNHAIVACVTDDANGVTEHRFA